MKKEANLPKNKLSGSFRDPCGYIYFEGSVVKRAVLPKYFDQYQALKDSGFFEKAIKHKLLIPHTEDTVTSDFISLTPEEIPFITYPYEWSFEQYKDAALHTLKLQKYAVQNGFILKDASAFNVFFHKGKPIFVDTLSFDFYKEDSPWRAFKMFVTNFLSPLVLAHYHGPDIFKMMQTHIDGIPLSLTSSLLPWRTKFNPMLYSNIHLMARMENKYQDVKQRNIEQPKLSRKKHLKHLDALYGYIQNLSIKQNSEWGNYYNDIHYKPKSLKFKMEQLDKWVDGIEAKKLLDIGGNNGTVARTLYKNIDCVVVGDIDTNAVDSNYKEVKRTAETNMIPLILNVLNPSPNTGYNNDERVSILERLIDFKPDVTLALAIVHHIALSGNVPFEQIAAFFSKISEKLIIEFPLRDDPMVQVLLKQKMEFENHFDFYTIELFEKFFASYFRVDEKIQIPNTKRVLFLMSRNDKQ